MRIWQAGAAGAEAHAPRVLESDDAYRLIAVRLPSGDDLGRHETHEAAMAVVTHGRVRVESEGSDPAVVGLGGVITFAPTERRAISALDDADLVLLLAPWPAEDRRVA